MAIDEFQNIQKSLDEKRQNLTDFLGSASKEEKDLCLCEEEQGVQTHLQVIESSLGKIEDGTMGICTVCHGTIETSLLEMDFTACICLEHYSQAERRRLEDELELSQLVQRALLPQQMPRIPGVDLAAFNRPSDIIGGDYYDFFQFRDGTPGLIIADVSGHGVSAGMLMSGLQTAVRTMAPDTDSPAEILERINRFYIHNIRFTTFVTVFLARFDPVTCTLDFVNAGHNPPALFRKQDGGTIWIMPTAPSVGLLEEYHPRSGSITLAAGDVLFLYTDGVTEAVNLQMEQFGRERLGDLIRKNIDLPAADMIRQVRQGISAFNDNKQLQDDITIITFKIN